MKYIPIDHWGSCFKNTPGEFYKTRGAYFEQVKINFLSNKTYKFLMAFEKMNMLQKRSTMLI